MNRNRIKGTILLAALVLSLMTSMAFAQEDYTPNRWDTFQKKVHLTVPQENQVKNLLNEERNQINSARAKAAEQILKNFSPEQRQKWDVLYRKADKQGGDVGRFKKRMLLNPDYLANNFTLKPEQKKILFYVSWDYARKVDKIRKKTNMKVQALLMKDQYYRWQYALGQRLWKEFIIREKF